jgi:E3 ubiquitin-protein ligase BIG BROTHER-like protein
MSYTELLELGEAMGRVVVAPTDQERNALPTQPFTAGCASKERECCICKCEYEEGEEVTTLPCFHTFHKACIMRWLENHNTCPVDMTVVRVSM